MLHKLIDRRDSRRGFSLIMMGVCGGVMVGMLGLTTDLGRVYIAKNELQSFADAASIAAALKLDGTSSGLDKAEAAGTTGPTGPSGTVNNWEFSTQTVPSPTITYSTTLNGTYSAKASAAVDSRFVKVLLSGNLPMLFLPIIPGIGSAMTVNAVATAGARVLNTAGAGGNNGLVPFSPDAHNGSDPNFGFTPGTVYTLKWPSNGQQGKEVCPGDATFADPNASADRDLIDLGQGSGAPGIGAILDDNVSYGGSYQVGSVIPWVTGGKTGPVSNDVKIRFDQDTDQSSLTYAQYVAAKTGNRRRILFVPVNDPALSAANGGNAYIMGFAMFFLQTDNSEYKSMVCAEYVGQASLDSFNPGPTPGTPGSYYSVQLFN